MKKYYSPSTGGTYLNGIHSNMPADARPISEERYQAVIANPAPGKIRSHDADGLPILVDPPMPEPSEIERVWRDMQIASVEWMRDRHRDQLEIGAPTTLTAGQYQELLQYMQALRDWPQSAEFPAQEYRPVPAEWMLAPAGDLH